MYKEELKYYKKNNILTRLKTQDQDILFHKMIACQVLEFIKLKKLNGLPSWIL